MYGNGNLGDTRGLQGQHWVLFKCNRVAGVVQFLPLWTSTTMATEIITMATRQTLTVWCTCCKGLWVFVFPATSMPLPLSWGSWRGGVGGLFSWSLFLQIGPGVGEDNNRRTCVTKLSVYCHLFQLIACKDSDNTGVLALQIDDRLVLALWGFATCAWYNPGRGKLFWIAAFKKGHKDSYVKYFARRYLFFHTQYTHHTHMHTTGTKTHTHYMHTNTYTHTPRSHSLSGIWGLPLQDLGNVISTLVQEIRNVPKPSILHQWSENTGCKFPLLKSATVGIHNKYCHMISQHAIIYFA